MAREDPEDAMNEEELTGTASTASRAPNAFTALMAPKRKASPSLSPKKRITKIFKGSRDGLNEYILHPETYPPTRVIYYDSSFVAINDLYPKSSVHTLLLPRSKHKDIHPIDAFDDAEFLMAVKEQVNKLRHIVGKELQRLYGPYSKQDIPREKVLNSEVELAADGDLPTGRDWDKEVMAGIHLHPSMNHLHVHVLSRDRFSSCLKHRKHYNSFATRFFIPVEDFPLGEGDERRKGSFLNEDLVCWRCGKNFGNQFAKLKIHLEEEFEEWKRE